MALTFVAGGWAYRTLATASRWQGTPGKRLTGIRVVDGDGRRLTLARSALRATARWTSPLTLGAGSAVALGRGDGRALHDALAGTCVVGPRPARTLDAAHPE
jgi:uncharacterized RDD family membrane protein YckC